MTHGTHWRRMTARATARCRPGTSFAGGQRQCAFTHGLGGKEQGFADVRCLEVWIVGEDRGHWLPFGGERDDSGDGDAEPSQAGHAPICRG